ncbi:hypothetical protein, partial [Photobacterium sp. 1_MG-2023]|uniref:hypothetical protein n=1 Tax=Photobacterium sp. 1_MG-2023 TaxID=3062646 RepID=UPI0026E3D976
AGGAYQPGDEFGEDSFRPAKPIVSVGLHTLSASQMPSHGHPIKFSSATSGYGDSRYGGAANSGYTKHTQNTGGSLAHGHSVSVGQVGAVDTRQKSIAVIWIMKL